MVDADADEDGDSNGDLDAGYDPGTTYDAAPDPGRECVPGADNEAPPPPILLYPVSPDCTRITLPALKVGNVTDPDGDVLRYHFEIDREAGFRSMEWQQSPASGLPEGPGDHTEWLVPRPLVDGETYYWRAWVEDCELDSEKVVGRFQVCVE